MSLGADESHPPVVILGNTGSALSLTRSLGREGVDVYILGKADTSPAGASRYCTELVDCPEEGWLQWLEQRGPRGSVILPPGDPGVEMIIRNRSKLEELGYRLPDTAGETSLAMLDKTRTYELARAAGVPCPKTWEVRDDSDVAALRGEVPFPCALKPVHAHLFARHFPVKVLLANDERELMGHLERTRELGLEMLVTEVIPGPDHAIWNYNTYMDEQGQPQFELTRNRLRSLPVHFGTNTFLVTRWDPEVAAVGLRFCREVGLRGIADPAFKRDPRDGQLKLLECNLRFTNTQEVVRRAGIDLALFVYRRALGLPTPPMDSWREGVRLWFPARDLRAARDYRSEGSLSWKGWLRSLAHWPVYTPVASLDDPAPALVGGWRKVTRRAQTA